MAQDTLSVQLVTIYEISKILGSSLDLHKTLRGVLSLLSSHLHMQRSMVSLVQEDGGLQVVAAVGLSAEEIGRGRFLSGEGVTGRILQNCMPAVIPDVAKEPLFLNRTGSRKGDEEDMAFIGVPIKLGRRCIGVLGVDREGGKAGHFQGDVRFLAMVANLIGQSVRLHQNVAAEREQLMQDKRRLQKELQGKFSLDNVIGVSKRMQQVFADVHQAAPGKATILLRGESGTGKEAIARAIHYLSPRKDGPFIKLNCAALPESLLESELFGHARGAFTGAHADKHGMFQLAQGGTIFLTEIGDLPLPLQVKLLTVLDDREFFPLGSQKKIRVDVRLITGTHHDLKQLVQEGRFREDLFFRLNVLRVHLSPLRERDGDVRLLVDHFLRMFAASFGKNVKRLSAQALRLLSSYHYPGNVRELRNIIEYGVNICRGEVIEVEHLPPYVLADAGKAPRAESAAGEPGRPESGEKTAGGAVPEIPDNASSWSAIEKKKILTALMQTGGSRTGAAKALGWGRTTLWRKMKEYELA